MNIEVSIELASYGLKSNTTALTFERTLTDLDTGNYDGSPVYYFEVNAANLDSSDKTVYLVDSGDNTIASLTVGSGGSTGDMERIRSSSFTPTSGSESYRVKLEDTTSANQLEVTNARILIQQTDFTKTRIPFDVLAEDGVGSNADTELAASNGGYPSVPQNTHKLPFYRYDSGYFSGTVSYEFEMLSKRTGGSACWGALFRVSNGNKVANSELSVSASSFTVYRATIGADSEWVSGNDYQAAIGVSHVFTTIRTAYAKVYITITNATKVRTYHQIGAGEVFGAGVGAGVTQEDRRYLYDADVYA
ncbi:MAG: hypothetical protein ACXABY_18695, partial [Candidatus Thorarchaeota archaeon]